MRNLIPGTQLQQPLDMAGITIEFATFDGIKKFVISLEGRDDLPPLRIAASKFSSGLEVKQFAHEWAVQNGLDRT